MAVAVAAASVCAVGRLLPAARARTAGRGLALLTVAAEISWWGYAVWQRDWTPRYNLPLHLCEVTAFVVAAALWWGRPLLVEIAYFWALAGVLPALFTPDIPGRFPEYVYFQYYAEHGMILTSALFLVVVLGRRPRPGAVIRISNVTLLYAAFAGAADYVTGGNYMFLRYLPATGTPLDDLGPWPWYLLSCAAIALTLFTVLNLPFAGRGAAGAAEQAPGASTG